MSLSKKELDHLKKLSRISHIEDEDKFLLKLDNIIRFLDKIKDLDLENSESCSLLSSAGQEVNSEKIDEVDNSLRVLKGSKKFHNTKGIMDNVKHQKINNSVVVKSVFK